MPPKSVQWSPTGTVVVPRKSEGHHVFNNEAFPERPEGVSPRNFRTLPPNEKFIIRYNSPTDLLRIENTIVYHFDTIGAILSFLKKRVTEAELVDKYTAQMDRGYQTDSITVNNKSRPTIEGLGASILTDLLVDTRLPIKKAFLIVMSYLIEIASTLFDKNAIIKNPYVLINPSLKERATNSVRIIGQADRAIEGFVQLSFGIGKMSGSGSTATPELIDPAGSTTNQANRKRYGSIVCKYEFKLMPNGAGSVHCIYTIATTDPTILANIRKIPDSWPTLMANYDKISKSLVQRLMFPEHTPGKTSGQAKAADEAAFNKCKQVVANTFLPAMQYRQTRPSPPVSVKDLIALFPLAQFPRENHSLTAITDYILYMYITVHAIKKAPCYSYARVKTLVNNAATQHSSFTSMFTGSQAVCHFIPETLSLSEKILGIAPPESRSASNSAPSAIPPPSSSSAAAAVLSGRAGDSSTSSPPTNALRAANPASNAIPAGGAGQAPPPSGLPPPSSSSMFSGRATNLAANFVTPTSNEEPFPELNEESFPELVIAPGKLLPEQTILRAKYDALFNEFKNRIRLAGKSRSLFSIGKKAPVPSNTKDYNECMSVLAHAIRIYNEQRAKSDTEFFTTCLELIDAIRRTIKEKCPTFIRITNLLEGITTGTTDVNVPVIEARTKAFLKDPNYLTIIWVRHGLSCQNIRPKGFLRKSDPELCHSGLVSAIQLGDELQDKLRLDNLEPIVGASVLMRAQQTAYLMLRSFLEHRPPIYILPNISEKAKMGVSLADNTPKSRRVQREFYSTYMPGINTLLNYEYLTNEASTQEYTPAEIKPKLDTFYKFVFTHFEEFHKRGLILFSHGNFIRDYLYGNVGKVGEEIKKSVTNCSAHRSVYRKTVDGLQLVDIEPYYISASPIESKEEILDPDTCLNATSPLAESALKVQYEGILHPSKFGITSVTSNTGRQGAAIGNALSRVTGVENKNTNETPNINNHTLAWGGRRIYRKTSKRMKKSRRKTRKSVLRKSKLRI